MHVLSSIVLTLLAVGAIHLVERMTGRNLSLVMAIIVLAFFGAAAAVAPVETMPLAFAGGIMLSSLYFWDKDKRKGAKISVEQVKKFVPVAGLALMLVMMLMPAVGVAAQTSEPLIDFGAEDLAVFWDFFNMIFEAMLPIALIGAALAAGATFVFVVANFLVRAFQNLRVGK